MKSRGEESDTVRRRQSSGVGRAGRSFETTETAKALLSKTDTIDSPEVDSETRTGAGEGMLAAGGSDVSVDGS